jgi:rhamnogalacturonyl hydrolase YesR
MITTLIASAVLAAAPSIDDLQALARLPGEPSLVSAVGMTRDDRPILTLENSSAFDAESAKRRVVVYAGARSETASAAVLEAVRWFKTQAPRELRDQWIVSALPAAAFADGDEKSFVRWCTFQAPDLAIEFVGDDAGPIGFGADAHTWVVRPPLQGNETFERILRGTKPGRSNIHETIRSRVSRDPLTIAKVLAAKYPVTPSISYIPSVAWTRTLRLGSITGDASWRSKVDRETSPWRSGERPLFGDRIQLTAIAGTMVFADLAAAGDGRARALADQGAALAMKEKAPGVAEYGGGWTDDMFMSASVLARAGARGDSQALETAVRLLTAYASRLQRPDGLFIHALDGPAAWGRGNGFAAFGLMEALTVMPPSHPDRAAVLDVFRRHMAAVKPQVAPDGMWREVIDEPGSYREETATAMLMTAMARGIRLGWIDASYRLTVDRAWRGLAAHVADDGTVIDVCTSTGSGPTKRYYMDRQAITGADDRGGAMALAAAVEMYELRHAPAVAAQRVHDLHGAFD